MKKMIALLLLMIMCLSFCACGVDKQYSALLEQLEVGNLNGIKNELSVLSPEFAQEQELLAKYRDLISLLEEENYDGAISNVTARMPVPEELETYDVEITTENWEQYFELREATHVTENVFGEIDYIYFGYGVFLRTEYAERIADNHVDVNFKYAMTDDNSLFYLVEFDKENLTYEVIERVYDTSTSAESEGVMQVHYYAPEYCSEKSDCYETYAGYLGTEPWEQDDGDTVLYIADNFQIVNAMGSLKLYS